MIKVASEYAFCVLIHTNSYMFLIYFIALIFLLNTNLIFDLICLTLSLADTHGVAKYVRIYIRRYTQTKKKQQKKKKNQNGGDSETAKKREKVKNTTRKRKLDIPQTQSKVWDTYNAIAQSCNSHV